VGLNGSTEIASSGYSLIAGAWFHIAVVKSGNTTKIYKNGIQVASSTTDVWNNATTFLRIGGGGATFCNFNGYIDELRIIKGTALTPDQIRQAYEYGLRSHPITIDFAAKLDSANLISGSGDTSFTVDATAYGLSQKGSNLYPGDKVIVRENIDGTEYIVQGTVKSVPASSGAVTVGWDSGLTFPSGGFSANASVFKWQREYFDLTGSLPAHRDAITNLTLRPTNGAEGRTVYLDDFRKSSGYLTDAASSTIDSSANRYLQYRAIVTTSDPAVSPSLTGVTVNNAPLAASYFTVIHNDYSALAGDVETITITAKDVNGNVVTNYAPATTLSITKTESGSQSGTAALSKTSLTSADFANGAATITLSDTEAENVEVIATDDINTAVTGTSLPVAFSPAAASKIVWTSSAQTLTAGAASGAYTVEVRDQYDNKRSSDAIVLDLEDSVPPAEKVNARRGLKEAIELVRSSLDWRKVGAIKGLDERRLRLVQNISYYLGEREVMAYSLTELCPSSNGRANVKLIDFLLRNAGREYVELLPALGDKLLSYGPKQWTKWAVYEGKGGPRGASIIDQAMPQTIDLPGSVAELRGNQHFMASMEFIINNLAYTIKDLDEK